MERTIEAIKKWMIAESFDSERQNNQFLEGIISLLSWTLRNMVPVILIALAIEIVIMLASPIKIAMSEWFWVKDPLSLVISYLIFRILVRKKATGRKSEY